jgi:hypothetical protein
MNELFTKQNTQMYFYQPKQYLERQLPENIPVYQYLNAQQTEKVWLVWMRGYHYYLNPKARIDSVFGAYRMELLLLNQSEKQIQRTLLTDQISHIIINWKYFLLEDNADRLGEGKTALLRRRFTELLDQGILKAERQFGPVWVYSVSDDEDESSKMSE